MRHSSDYAVPKGLTSTREFREKFNQMDSDPNLQREYYQKSKEMLAHRSGNNGEDLMFYNTQTGKWYISNTGTEAGRPDYNEQIIRGLKESQKGEIVSFHNYPTGMPPSDSDLNAALKNGYGKGYTIGHNGRIFEYTAPKELIPESSYLMHVESFKQLGKNEYDAQIMALNRLSEIYSFDFREVD
ncbi:MAG: hypothetical protein IJV39_01625 [Ruminococcus sp.]|nr:hypothetical protein [Ruminococcus sp.]